MPFILLVVVEMINLDSPNNLSVPFILVFHQIQIMDLNKLLLLNLFRMQ